MAMNNFQDFLNNYTNTGHEKAFAIQTMINLQSLSWEQEKYGYDLEPPKLYDLIKRKNEIMLMLLKYPIDCIGRS